MMHVWTETGLSDLIVEMVHQLQDSAALQHHNTQSLQHHNTQTLQHHNTQTLQHHNPQSLQHPAVIIIPTFEVETLTYTDPDLPPSYATIVREDSPPTYFEAQFQAYFKHI